MLTPAQVLASNITLLIWLPILALLTFLATRFITQWTRRRVSSDSEIPSGITLIQRPVLTQAEAQFFRVLQAAVGSEYTIFPQLSIWTMIEAGGQDPAVASVMNNRISRKRIDFLLVESATLRPCMAIELDDRSHQRDDRQKRDVFVDKVFDRAGLKLVHIRGAATYNPETVRIQLGLPVRETLSA